MGDRITYSHLIGEQADSLRCPEVRVRVFGVDDRRTLRGISRNVRNLRSAIRRQSPDIVHSQYGSFVALVSFLAAGTTPLVVSFCGTDILGLTGHGLPCQARNILTRAVGIVAAARASAIIVKSGNLLDALPAPLRRKAHVIPNGVDLSFFRPLSKRLCREHLGWPKKKKVVLFNHGLGLGRPIKNLSLAKSACEALQKSVPEMELRVITRAARAEVALMLNAADCLLVTSHHEGSPNIVKEAMACNLPVVSVPCGDVSERLANQSPGGVCPSDPESLAARMEEVLASGERSNGREELFRQNLTTYDVAARIRKTYTFCAEPSRHAADYKPSLRATQVTART